MMKYSMDHILDMYIKEFPDHKRKIDEHIELNGMMLGHVFFDEEICDPLCRLLKRSKTHSSIDKLVSFVEVMMLEGDEYVQSIVTCNMIEKIKNQQDMYSKAKVHFSPKLIDAFNNMER